MKSEITTDTQTKHTPLPWRLVLRSIILRSMTEDESSFEVWSPQDNKPGSMNNFVVADGIQDSADAQFIVRACNAHYELLEFVRAYADGELCDRVAAKALLARAALQKAQSV